MYIVNLIANIHKRNIHFWRDSNGVEVDLIADSGTKLMPVEIKSGQTLNRDFFSGLSRWTSLAGDKAVDPVLIFGGTEVQTHKGIKVLGWNKINELPFSNE